jgi:hypothetical protein
MNLARVNQEITSEGLLEQRRKNSFGGRIEVVKEKNWNSGQSDSEI